MSAFIVEDKTINKIVCSLSYNLDHNLGFYKMKFGELGFIDINGLKEKELANAMFEMNVKAVNQRYGNGEAEKFRPLNFKYYPYSANTIEVYKALECFLYQCSEGDVFKSKLFKLLNKVKNAIAREIVSNLPEYRIASWN